jgi:hypothetical protein
VHIDAQDHLHFTGRVKDMFKTSKGKYVAPAPIEDKQVRHESVDAGVMTGANLGQPLGIVMLNEQAVARIRDTATRAELEASLSQQRQGVNDTLYPHEQLKCLVNVTSAWAAGNDTITPTIKVKRNRIEDIYSADYKLQVTSAGRRQGKRWPGKPSEDSLNNQFRQDLANPVIDIVTAVFRVPQQGTAALLAGVHVAPVAGEKGHGQGRIGGAVTRAMRMELLNRWIFNRGVTQGAKAPNLLVWPAVLGKALPAAAGAQRAATCAGSTAGACLL